MMHSDQSQQTTTHNYQQQNALLQQMAQALLQASQPQQGVGYGQGWLGQGAYGQSVYGSGGFGQPNPWGGMFSQRQLTSQDVSAVLQQIAPILPQIIAQAQQQQFNPQAAFGGGFGASSRSLSPQDVNEVVRQILPVIPQLLQSMQQPAWQTGGGAFGLGPMGGYGQPNTGWGQAAYGASPQLNPFLQNQPRQLTPQDIAEAARHVVEAMPSTLAGQAFAQQRI